MKKVIDNPYDYIEGLKALSKDIRSSINDEKALAANVYSLTKTLNNSEFGMIVNDDMARVCATEETEFRQKFEALKNNLISTRASLIDYIKTNDVPDSEYVLYSLDHQYNAWQDYYSKETHDESLLQRCSILRDAIAHLASIEESGERPHLNFLIDAKFGKFHADGTIENLHMFELLLLVVSDGPLLCNRDSMLSQMWDTLVKFHESENHRQFASTTGPLLLNSHAQEIISYGSQLLTPSRAAKKILENEITIDYDRKYRWITITRGPKIFLIPPKGGPFDQAVVHAIFPDVIGKGISLNDILNNAHRKLSCKDCTENNYGDGCKTETHRSIIDRFNAHVEKWTSGKIVNLVERNDNRFKVRLRHN